MQRSVVALALLGAAWPVQAQRPAASTENGVVIRAVVVGKDFQPRPLALFPLEISGPGRRDTVRTSLSGSVELRLPAGTYRVRSLESAAVESQKLGWDVDLTVVQGPNRDLELTNVNAQVVAQVGPTPSPAAPTVSAKDILNKFGSAVVRVEAGLAHGTGFLIAAIDGAIVTNDHVVSGERTVSVYLDSTTRVRAVVVRRDRAADVAILKIPTSHLIGRARLTLSRDVDPPRTLQPGETVYALGYPLSQGLTLTSGIVSSIRLGAVISDVNINPGNSGGPMLSADGLVVAVTTFGDQEPGRGSGLGGAVLVSQLSPILSEAAAAVASAPEPDDRLLPTLPPNRIPADGLRALVESADLKMYEKAYQEADAKNFTLIVTSPIASAVLARAREEYLAADRRRREAAAGVSAEERFDPGSAYQWSEYTGDMLTPIVQVTVLPKEGETGGSVFKRLMLGPNLQATYRFKGDVRDLQVFKDSVLIEPIKGGTSPLRRFENNRWVEMRDVANAGVLILDARTFAPRPDGSLPQIVIGIDDLKRPGEKYCFAFAPDLTARIWNDFSPLVNSIWPGENLLPATIPPRGRSRIDKRFVPSVCREAGGRDWVY